MSEPRRPQPFHPPVAHAPAWIVPRDGIGELAAIMYEQVRWGREPHPSQVSEAEMAEWESVRAQWEEAMLRFLGTLDEIGHLTLETPA